MNDLNLTDSQQRYIKAAIYTMLSEAGVELLSSDKEPTASNLLALINEKVEAL